MNSIVRAVFLAASISSVMATNYCSASLCRRGVAHIACGHSRRFAASCPRNAFLVNINENLKNAIVKAHNVKRNFIAGGGVRSLQPACRMATMKWDNELASLAALNVLQCKMSHDKCHNTDTFKFSGQNLGWRTYYGTPNYGNLVLKTIDSWYNEVKYTSMNYIKTFPRNYRGPAIGHFTIMMADRNIRVGCAAASYAANGSSQKQFLFACNYATTNMVDHPIYTSCRAAASSCKTGKNHQFSNLCSVKEEYNVNKWF